MAAIREGVRRRSCVFPQGRLLRPRRARRRGGHAESLSSRGRSPPSAHARRGRGEGARPALGRAVVHRPGAARIRRRLRADLGLRLPRPVRSRRTVDTTQAGRRRLCRGLSQAARGGRAPAGRRGGGPRRAGVPAAARVRGRGAAPHALRHAAEEGGGPRGCDPGARCPRPRVGRLPLQDRGGRAGHRGEAGVRLRAGHAALLPPLVVDARRGSARGGREREAARSGGAQVGGPADARRPGLAALGRGVRHAVAPRPRLFDARREKRRAVPRVRRPAGRHGGGDGAVPRRLLPERPLDPLTHRRRLHVLE